MLKPYFLLRIYRTGRKNWIAGETFTLFIIAAFYTAVITAVTLILTLTVPHTADGKWSMVATDYLMVMGDQADPLTASLLPKNLFKQMSPVRAVIWSVILIFCYLILMWMIMLLAASMHLQVIGIAINAACILAGTGLAVLSSDFMWTFPCAHALVWVHYTEYFREPVLSLSVSAVYFALLFGILLLLSLFFIKKRNFDSTQEFE